MNKENNEFEVIKNNLKNVQKQMSTLRNKEYELNEKYVDLVKEKCKENVGRCFKKLKDGKVISYCRIVNIDRTDYNLGRILFNENQYPSLWFDYPYKNSVLPFYEENLFSGAWGKGNDHLAKINGISYVEINKEEFLKKFNEVNSEWIKKI